MRTLPSKHLGVAACLALALPLLIAAAPAKKRPVMAPGAEAPTPPPAPPQSDAAEKEEEAATSRSRRPVTSPNTVVPAAPPPVPRTDAPAAAPAQAAPATEEAPPPSDFVGGPEVTETSRTEVEVQNPGEIRYHTRIGSVHWTVSLQPGLPQPGEPLEISFRLEEQLPIPDPRFGDRKPVTDVPFVVKVHDGAAERLHSLHPAAAPGNYAFRFTPGRSGVHTLKVQRNDGRAGYQAEFKVPVALPPLESTRALRVERLVGPQPNDSNLRGLMRELGRRWMALERKAGSTEAEAALASLVEQARKIRGGATELEHADLSSDMVAGIEAIQASGARAAVIGQMDRVRDQTCLRCHAKYRLEFADSVLDWPKFEVRRLLAPKSQPTSSPSTPRRAPVAPGQ